MNLPGDSFHEECAVVGLINVPEASNFCYLSLYSLQHRGQEGAGIVTSDGEVMVAHRDMGLVADVFTEETLGNLQGNSAVGHTRYATFGSKDWANLQPFVANFADNSFAVAHNGNLINAHEIRSELELTGSIFSSTSDTEVILHLIAKAGRDQPLSKRVADALSGIRGAYSLVVLSHTSLVAVRDPHGVRPLSLGKLGNGYIVASETCAFDLVGAEFIRDIEPGEILQIHKDGSLHSNFSLREGAGGQSSTPDGGAFCVFEYVYFSRPDSIVQGKNVYQVRKNLGAELAKEHPLEADLVIPVPDSGVPSAIGYSQQSGIPLEIGLIRNHYVGRTFIEPKQAIRDFGVKVKLNANADVLSGKRVIVVDDSIVRGTTSRKLVAMLRAAGTREIHFRISSPPTVNSCYYGIDTPSRDELIAATHSLEESCKFIGADSLAYLSIEGMYRAVGAPRKDHCDACFSSCYKLGVPDLGFINRGCGDSSSGANRSNRPRPGNGA
ncbi:MAG TPA: amidophosphoribosyltransferase [Oligoflexia bacterium]|nr:amidophosphoribosyltransferase [Oligoflexia bacterium]HMP47106.1 amidophosphoribosyltransferase [Oligoflexia bacterium]